MGQMDFFHSLRIHLCIHRIAYFILSIYVILAMLSSLKAPALVVIKFRPVLHKAPRANICALDCQIDPGQPKNHITIG